MKKLTKALIKKIDRALKADSYSVEFEAKNKHGWDSEWILMTKKRFNSDQNMAERRGYDKRIEEEKEVSVFNLMGTRQINE